MKLEITQIDGYFYNFKNEVGEQYVLNLEFLDIDFKLKERRYNLF